MALQQGAVALAGRQASDGLLLQALPADVDAFARRSIGCAKQTGQSKIEQVRQRLATHLMQHAIYALHTVVVSPGTTLGVSAGIWGWEVRR